MRQGLNLDSLVVLDAIARSHSFAAAAEELHRVPSSVTYAIQKLESNLDVTLFDRKGHKAQLTPAGEALLIEGRHLLGMADSIERTIKRVETGWEAEFRIAVSDLLPYQKVLDLCDDFYQVAPDTRIKLTTEVLAGSWDALISGRADFVLGAAGEGPPGGGYSSHPLGEAEFVFVVSPDHPLAHQPEPLPSNDIRRYRAVAAADSSRSLPSLTYGLLSGQNVLTVPDLEVKRQAQLKGIGVGYLPRHLIKDDIKSGKLIVKSTEEGIGSSHQIHYVWRTKHRGKALAWFRRQLIEQSHRYDWFGD